MRKLSLFLMAILLACPFIINAQENSNPQYNRDILITAARNMIEANKYCVLITLDEAGHPGARIMNPFFPDENMVIWLGTNKNSKKVQQLKKDSRASLFYEGLNEDGYLLIKGNAYLVDDPEKKKTYWKEEWNQFYGDKKEYFTLIKVIPYRLEILDLKNGIYGNPKTWTVPSVEFTQN